MDAEKIVQDLTRRFSAPLPEFYNRRIVFWHDEDQKFESQIDDLELNNVKIIKLTGSNQFAVKKLLTIEDTTSNYLVYCPIYYDSPEKNWLINIELYSGEPFRADIYTAWMDEIGLVQSPNYRELIKRYSKFFNAKERRNKIIAMADKIEKPAHIHLAVMAAICGVKEISPNAIIRSVLEAGLVNDENSVYQSFINYEVDTAFWQLISQGTGYKNTSLAELAAHILLTATTRTMNKDNLAGLERFISIPHQSFCFDFVSEWIHCDEYDSYRVLAEAIEEELKLFNRFNSLNIEAIYDTEVFPCISSIILIKLMTDIKNQIIPSELILTSNEKRRTMLWYKDVSCYYEGLIAIAYMQGFFTDHAAGFHIAEAKEIWKAYTSDYYKMDQYYRQFHCAFQKSLTVSNDMLDDLFKHVADKVEALYSGWYLTQLSDNWTSVSGEDLEKHGYIPDIKRQVNFYSDHISSADSRIFVIISDALRYEVAVSLSEQLRRETQSEVSIDSMCGIYPTITPFGMAALLPHNELTAELKNDKLVVLADGQPTDSLSREKVLKTADENSVALQYKNIIGMKRAERSELVKGMNVVYIYHDKIDETSHTSETSVFSACETAIDEIKNMVRIIANEFGGARIYITADHGFLYTYSPLTEDDKVSKESWNGNEVNYSRRHSIMRGETKPEYLQPIKFLNGKTEFSAYAPKGNVRIKTYGSGLNFVHGGMSLQEMVVPLIDYHFLRNDYKQYRKNKSQIDTKPVEITLLSANRKISNMIFSLNFFQKDAVGDNREAAVYSIYFTDSTGTVVSDTAKIIADKISSDAQERTFRCNFNLKSMQFDSKEIYYLVIANEDGVQMPQREEFQIDIAFAVDEFNFF